MASDEQLSPAEQAEREAKVRRAVAAFKSFADFGTSPKGRADLVQRLASTAVASHVLNAEQAQHGNATPLPIKLAASAQDWEPASLAALLERHLGPQWVEYEPDTLMDATHFTPEQTTRALCARHILYDVSPFTDWHVFEKMAVASNGRTIDFTEGQELEPHELAWAAAHMRLIDPVTPFGEEVKNYIAFLLRTAGLVCCPDDLHFCDGNLHAILTDHGRDVKAACQAKAVSPATEHQAWLKDICARYVSAKYDKLMKELESL